jgi:pimeloyl-ACP methyl ester carboxylesterase
MNVIFLHGFGEDATVWADFLKFLDLIPKCDKF